MPSKDLHVPGSAAALRWLENPDGVRHIVTGSAHRKHNSVQVFDQGLTSICSATHDGPVYDLDVLPQNVSPMPQPLGTIRHIRIKIRSETSVT